MRYIDLRPYATELDQTTEDGRSTGQKLPFDVRSSIVALLFSGSFAPRELVRRDALARQIEGLPDGLTSLALEDEEWNWIVAGLEAARPTGRHFTEFTRRVFDAPRVAAQSPGA